MDIVTIERMKEARERLTKGNDQADLIEWCIQHIQALEDQVGVLRAKVLLVPSTASGGTAPVSSRGET